MPARPRWARAAAPCSISNVGPGFDVFGIALLEPADEVVVRRVGGCGIQRVTVTGDRGLVPTDHGRNAAALAARGVLDQVGESVGITIEVHKGIPIASGLGGSAASAVAGAVAVNALLGTPLDTPELLAAAMIGEAKGSGADHADNAAPSLIGGFVLVLPGQPARMVRLDTPPELTVAVAHPHMMVQTLHARRALGDHIPLSAGIAQWGNSAGVVAALWHEDWELLGHCLTDSVAEPVRAALVPGFDAVRQAALGAGAVGSGLSGSGPSVFALCRSDASAGAAADAMRAAFRREANMDSDTVVSAVNTVGARILEVG